MGVKQFFKLPGFVGQKVSITDFAGSRIAIDCMTEIYRAAMGMGKNPLKDSEGRPTAHINILIRLAINMQNADIKPIYVFDNPTPPPEKAVCLAARNINRDNTLVNSNVISDVQLILQYLGMPYMVAPSGCDAEHLCAVLNKTGQVDHILTTDADAFMYGAISILKYEKRQLVQYTLDRFTKATGLDRNGMLRLGACLGTDFCNKSHGIGPKTVVKKCLNVELTPEQQAAIEVFNRPCEVPAIISDADDKPALLDWLETRSFNRARMAKIIGA